MLGKNKTEHNQPPQPGTSGQIQRSKDPEPVETARSVAARMIVDAEKFQAEIAQPQGMYNMHKGVETR